MPVSNGTLGELVRAKRPEILAAGTTKRANSRRRARRCGPPAGEAITTLLDHVAEVAERMAAGESQLSQEVARQHARGRAHEGLEFAEVLRDFAALRARDHAQRPARAAAAAARRPTRARPRDRRGGDRVRSQHIEQRDRSLRWVDRMACAILETKTLDDACRQALAVFIQAVPLADVAAIFLRDGEFLRPRACSGPEMELGRLPVLNLEEALVFNSAAQREPQQPPAQPLIPANAAALLRPNAVDGDTIDALVCLPLQCAGELIGIVYVGSAAHPRVRRRRPALVDGAGAARGRGAQSADRNRARPRCGARARRRAGHGVARPRQSARRVLISASSLLGSGLNDDADHGMTKGLQAIHRAAGRMRRMIQDLVDFVNDRLGAARAAHRSARAGGARQGSARGLRVGCAQARCRASLRSAERSAERAVRPRAHTAGSVQLARQRAERDDLGRHDRPAALGRGRTKYCSRCRTPGRASPRKTCSTCSIVSTAARATLKPHRSIGLALAVARSIVDAHEAVKIGRKPAGCRQQDPVHPAGRGIRKNRSRASPSVVGTAARALHMNTARMHA